MDQAQPVAPPADLSALAWVHEELRKTLESAHKALRRYLRDAEASRLSDLDDVEPTILRTARQQLHQGVGALELVNLPEGAMLLRACEAAVQRFIARAGRIDAAGVEKVEQASFALLDFMGRRLAGKPAPAVALFPQLRALLELNGAERVHPADLWLHDWRWRELPAQAEALPGGGQAAMQSDFERRLLMLVRSNAPEAAAALARDCAWVGADCAAQPGAGVAAPTFWRIAAAFFEAWSLGLIAPDVFVKRSASRVMAQLRARGKGDREVSDRLAQDLLFYCARALPPDGASAPWLRAVRQAYRLPAQAPVDYETPFYGRFDPAQLAQARKRVAAAKEAWNGVAAGELHRLDSLLESFSLVGDSIRRLHPAGEPLAAALTHAAVTTARLARPPAVPLGMEVATSLLYLDAALEESEFDQPGQAGRSERLAQRIEAAATGEPPQSLEPWMEELYRRVSDRQTMGSVVHELRAALSEVERQIDQYFRHPRESGVLAGVPGQLAAMRGVLSVLGVEAAEQASTRMRDDVERLLHGEADPQSAQTLAAFQRLAGNLGALGFLIDMLAVQPQMARSLFRFDAATGLLAPVMGRSAMAPDLIDRAHAIAAAVQREEVPLQEVSAQIDALAREQQVSAQPALAARLDAAQEALDRAGQTGVEGPARGDVAQALGDFVATATQPGGLEPQPASPSLVSRPIPLHFDEPPKFVPTGLEDDQEMRDVFLEESGDVLTQAGAALAALAEAPSDVAQITTVRRAFHTLKGSARMVGLAAFGEAAWACEQLYNHWLAGQTPASVDLRTFTGDALQYFEAWTRAIARGDETGFVPEPVVAAAEALRLAGELMRVPLPGDHAPMLPAALPTEPMDLGALDLEVPSESPATPVLEPLQATRPLELQPLWEGAAQERSLAGAAQVGGFELDLDLGGDAATLPTPEVSEELSTAAAAALDLDLGLPAVEAPARPAEPGVPVLPADWPEMAEGDVERIEVAEGELPTGSPASWRAPLETDLPDLEAAALPGGPQEAAPTEPPTGWPAAATLPEEPAPEPEQSAEAPVGAQGASAAEFPEVDLPAGEGLPVVPEISLQAPVQEEAPALPAGAEVIRLEDFRSAPAPAGELAEPTQPGRLDRELEEADGVKVIGPLRLQIPLFNIYLNEADELSRRLSTELAEWSLELHRPVGDTAAALAHSLAGSSFTVGFEGLAQLSRDLEHALADAERLGRREAEDAALFTEVAEEIRRLLHQFAAGFLRSPPEELVQRLRDWRVAVASVGGAEPSAPALPLDLQLAQDDGATASPGLDLDLDLGTAAPGVDLPLEAPPAVEPLQLSPELAWPWAEAEARATAPDLLLPVDESAPSAGLGQPPAVPGDVVALDLDLPLGGEPDVVAASAPPLPPLTLSLQPVGAAPAEPAAPAGDAAAQAFEADIDARDEIDAELFPIFEEEAEELMPRLAGQLGEWLAHPGDAALATACMRTLHTFKGSARLAGAMRLGELAHRFESAIEALQGAAGEPARSDLETLQQRGDQLAAAFEALRRQRGAPSPSTLAVLGGPAAPAEPPRAAAFVPGTPAAAPMSAPVPAAGPDAAPVVHEDAGMAVQPADGSIDWSRFLGSLPSSRQVAVDRSPASTQPVRVRAPLLDRLVNLAGEVSITRTRLEAEVGQIRASLADLTDNLERLDQQLHDIALQAETQLESRMEAARAALQEFDPLELDRYTRLQELTRMMAESVNDVATVRSTLQRTLQTTEDELAVQARLTRELQGDLLRTRMVEFESLSERLYRVVRQASKETGKQVRFDIVGGSIEVDRGVLDRMTAAFEHLLRNCVTHGIESPDVRTAAGKDPTGSIVVTVEQEGNEVSIEIRDDGAGLDLARIRAKAVEMGLIGADQRVSDRELANLIMAPGLSTAAAVTELAGRGVGMDVVRSDVQSLGGRVETRSNAGRGTRFKLVLPLTTVVTQVVILRAGDRSIAVPSNLVELVQRATPTTLEDAYEGGSYDYGGLQLPFYWLGALLQSSARGSEVGRTLPVVIVRSAQQRVALHVDEVLGSHEVVVKNLGPQLSSLPGLAGMTLLPSGAVALIYNPVALASVYGPGALQAMRAAHPAAPEDGVAVPAGAELALPAPLVLVVDDSLTVRRITKRLLEREGYRVALAKDGLEALDLLGGERPAVVLSDIEMPRMDGFDLLRNIRGDAALAGLPVVMITSRIAQKHRDIALELGANHYLGKPYSEEELLTLIRRHAAQAAGQSA
ncbi:MAG: Hpt domain-containing protein [Burkholderiaceae bacterium]|nr:Hpt domain-containing protein [Burkholderiaceae bacterium]